jgi:uncharacterized membrane-anchored protein YitT (DUF2179 family)
VSTRDDDGTLSFAPEETAHSVVENILGIATGTFVAALGLYLLKAGGAVTGGTAGLVLLLTHLADALPFGVLYFLVNLPFAVLGLWRKGWRFALLTVISIAIVSALAEVNDAMLPLAAVDPVYAALGGNLLAGIGMLVLFRHGSSLGGINVVALLVQDRTGFRAGWTQLVFDMAVVAASFAVLPWPTVLLSAGGAVLLNLVLAMNHRPGRYIGH